MPGFLAQNNRSLHETANQKKDILFDFPSLSPGNQPLTKKPEDSGIEIGSLSERTGLKNVCACADLGAENPEICFEPSILDSVGYLRLLENRGFGRLKQEGTRPALPRLNSWYILCSY